MNNFLSQVCFDNGAYLAQLSVGHADGITTKHYTHETRAALERSATSIHNHIEELFIAN